VACRRRPGDDTHGHGSLQIGRMIKTQTEYPLRPMKNSELQSRTYTPEDGGDRK